MKSQVHKIRFGVISDSPECLVWQDMIIKKLASQVEYEFVLLLIPSNTISGNPLKFRRASSRFGSFWNFYFKTFVKWRVNALQKAGSFTDFGRLFQLEGEFSCDENNLTRLDDDTLTALEAAKLDFILDFTMCLFTGRVIDTTKYGVWSYRFGDPEKNNPGIACFEEIKNEDPVTRGCLVKLTGSPDQAILLKDGYLKTQISFAKNIDAIYFECTSWPLQVARDLQHKRIENLSELIRIVRITKEHFPGSRSLAGLFLMQLRQLLKKARKSLFFTDYWNIGVTKTPISEFLDPKLQPQIHWVPNLPKQRFIADPFGMFFDDELRIIYEDFRFDQGIGKIASRTFHADSFSDMELVIDEEFHLSYPFLLKHEGDIYCIPETHQKNQVCLYKVEDLSTEWTLKKVLIDGYAGLDNTVIKHENTWYLFSTDKHSGPHYNLNIHFAQDLVGPWRAHPKNPVKTDIRSARPAGTMFRHNDDLFRPSMDYSEKSEGRIIINKILKLTTEEFREQAHTTVNPFKNTYFADKIHTLSESGAYTLVDGAKELCVFNNFNALKYKLKVLKYKFKAL